VKHFEKIRTDSEDVQMRIKDGPQKIFYGKPYERRFDNLDRGCDLQVIDQCSDVD
jgi:hypothetical protein